MKLRTSLVLVLAAISSLFRGSGIGGLLESPGPDAASITVHLLAPSLLGIVAAGFWRSTPWRQPLLFAFGGVLVAEGLRFVIFHGPNWQRILTDSKHQFLLLASLGVQLTAAFLGVTAARLVLHGHEKGTV